MATLTIRGIPIYYEMTGEGAETLVFSHGLLLSTHMWEAQIPYFSQRYRCVVYDHRGHGRSGESPAPFDIDTLYEDAVELIEKLGVAPCHFIGLSMGGFVGMRIAARRPDLLKSCILLNTSADVEPHRFRYGLLNLIARLFGLGPVVDTVLKVMFGRTFLADPEKANLRAVWRERLLSNRRSITRAVSAVLNRQPVLHELEKIKIPILIIAGEEDVATPPLQSEKIRQRIPHARYHVLPRVGHLSPIEAPDAVNALIEDFIQEVRNKKE